MCCLDSEPPRLMPIMPMPITRIMLDLDDVCNKFTAHAMRYVGCPSRPYPQWCGYDIVAAVNHLHPTRDDWTPDEFWAALGRDLWDDMPVSDIYPWILDACVEEVGRSQVFICTSMSLTSLTDSVECTLGKINWMQRTLPDWLARQCVLTPHKEVTATPTTLLIDDCHQNVVNFRKAGGQTMLIPAPWNPYKCSPSIDMIENPQQSKTFT